MNRFGENECALMAMPQQASRRESMEGIRSGPPFVDASGETLPPVKDTLEKMEHVRGKKSLNLDPGTYGEKSEP